MDYIIIVIFVILIIIYILCTIKEKKETFTPPKIIPKVVNTNTDGNCLCVFDIDHTITCGNPQPVVEKCKELGCRLAINTARPKKYTKDIDMDAMGFHKPFYNEEDFYYNPNSYQQHPIEVGNVKTNYLELLRNKYTIHDKKRVILFDDSPYNLESAKNNGFSIIQARRNKLECGIDHRDTDLVEQILQEV